MTADTSWVWEAEAGAATAALAATLSRVAPSTLWGRSRLMTRIASPLVDEAPRGEARCVRAGVARVPYRGGWARKGPVRTRREGPGVPLDKTASVRTGPAGSADTSTPTAGRFFPAKELGVEPDNDRSRSRAAARPDGRAAAQRDHERVLVRAADFGHGHAHRSHPGRTAAQRRAAAGCSGR